MPSGKTHDNINIVFLVIFMGMLTYIGFNSLTYSVFFITGFLFGTYLCGPDLDTKSNVYKRWKWLRFIWWPYRRVFPHRSIWTHGVFIGDIIRLFYLGACMSPILIVLNQFTTNEGYGWVKAFYQTNAFEIWFFIIGIIVASTSHIFSDIVVSSLKKLKIIRKNS